jgi:hypothetical protein
MFPGDADPEGKPKEVPDLAGATEIVFGGGTGQAVMPDGTVKGWGSNVFNTLNMGKDKRDQSPPAPIPDLAGVTATAAGQNHGCALLGDGTATCWGFTSKELPATKVTGVTDATAIASGAYLNDTCVITKAKTVMCWGETLEAKPLEGIDNVVAISGRSHFCALKGDATVWCWGDNYGGQLGNGKIGGSEYTPTQVAGVSDVVSISAGPMDTCVVKKDGSAACWGQNRYGQLGDGTLMDRTAPVAVVGLNDKKPPAPVDGSDQAQESSVTQSWDGLPADCKHDPLDASYKTLSGKFDVVSAFATNDDGKGLTWIVWLANYKMDPANLYTKQRGKQIALSLRFANIDLQKDRTPMVVDPGVYSMDHEQSHLVVITANDRVWGTTLGDLSLEGVKAGEVEIKHLDADWICGELRVTTKTASFTGQFAAPVQKK